MCCMHFISVALNSNYFFTYASYMCVLCIYGTCITLACLHIPSIIIMWAPMWPNTHTLTHITHTLSFHLGIWHVFSYGIGHWFNRNTLADTLNFIVYLIWCHFVAFPFKALKFMSVRRDSMPFIQYHSKKITHFPGIKPKTRCSISNFCLREIFL